jgi:hypothetical protein
MKSHESDGASRFGPAARWCAIIALFLAVSVVATWPLVLHLGTHLPAGARDLYQNVWNFWWWKKALLEFDTSPYFTHLLYAPEGLDLAFNTHSELHMLLLLPINVLAGHVAAYNVSILLALVLCGLGGYLLLRELVRDETAALAGGLFFTLFPQHLEQLFEHLNLASCEFMPFALLFLIRTFRYGLARDGMLTGVFFALNALAGWHLGLLLILLGAPCTLWYWRQSPCRRRAIGWLSAGGVLATTALLPFLWPMLTELVAGTAYFKKPLVYRPIDPAFLFLPPPQSTLTGSLAVQSYVAHRGNASQAGGAFAFQYAGFICFLGWIPLALAIYRLLGLRRDPARREVLFWGALFLVFLILAMGAYPTIYGKSFEGISLPQAWTQQLPGFRVLRVANRYLIPGSIALAVLVAGGFAALPKRRLLRGAVLVLMPLEFLWVPFPIEAFPQYPYLAELAKDPAKGIVLEIPPCLGPAQVDAMIRQTSHGAPIVGGYASCVPPEKRDAVALAPYLRGLAIEEDTHGPAGPPEITSWSLAQLKARGIGTIIVRPSETREALRKRYQEGRAEGKLPFFLRRSNPASAFPEAHLDQIIGLLRRRLGPPIHEDEDLIVWRL